MLKKILIANASFSLVCGIALLVFSTPIAAFMGDLPNWLLMVVGGGLVVFAADVCWISRQLPQAKARAQIILWADVAWVMATPIVLVLFAPFFSQAGIFVMIDIAAIVALFAFFEWKGLRQLDSAKLVMA